MKRLMKKEKGKTKSEKVWTSLLFAFSLLLFTSLVARGEMVEYMDGGDLNTVECQLLTKESFMISGWYAVKGEVVHDSGSGLVVVGAVHLILCDGASLTIKNRISNRAGITVADNGSSLTIYGQTKGSGMLTAQGGEYGAGIGGDYRSAGGKVTINGGIVKVTGGTNAAGIGGGSANLERRRTHIGDSQHYVEYGYAGGEVTINGGTVTANGGKNGAGIGGGQEGAGGTVAINGGRVMANGGWGGAGIGGGNRGAGGTVTINGGKVTATGGLHGAGIGGGEGGAGGSVTINGGEVTAMIDEKNGSCGANIGCGSIVGIADTDFGVKLTINGGTVMAMSNKGNGDIGISSEAIRKVAHLSWYIAESVTDLSEVTINGGSVRANSISVKPKNRAGKEVSCVTVECGDLTSSAVLAGLGDYGTKDIVPVNGRVYLWLPEDNRLHNFSLSDQQTTLNYCAVANGLNLEVEPVPVGFFVNGRDVGEGPEPGAGWSYANEVLTFERGGEYVLSGAALENEMQIMVDASGVTLILSNAVVITSGRAALEVGKNASISMAGDTSYLITTNNASAVTVAEGKKLTVDLGSDKDRLESMICVLGSEKNAIGGGGTVEVNGGTFFAWSDKPAFAGGTVIECGEMVVMKTGDNPETVKFASAAGEAPCVLVAPVVTVTVANDIPHVSGFTVSNAVERIEGEEIGDSRIYRVMLEDDVFVGYTVEEGFVSQVGNPLVYREVEDENITIAAEVLKTAVAVTFDKPRVFATAEEATNALEESAFTPSREVATELTLGALEMYCEMFELGVVATSDGQWAVEAVLKPADWTNVVESARAATRQIPLADLAALELGVPTEVTVEGCVPGFYYSFYSGSMVTNLGAVAADLGRNVLCGPEGEVKFSGVVKPSDAAGFFSIGVLPTPDVDAASDCTTSNLWVNVTGRKL